MTLTNLIVALITGTVAVEIMLVVSIFLLSRYSKQLEAAASPAVVTKGNPVPYLMQ